MIYQKYMLQKVAQIYLLTRASLVFSPIELKLDESIRVTDTKTNFKLSNGNQCKIKLRK